MINAIRKRTDYSTDMVSNVPELGGEHDKCLHIVWLYPNILNIHGGRGDVMALLHVSNLMGLPVEIKRCNSLNDEIPFEWADMIYMTSGELKCMPEITAAIERQREGLDQFVAKGGTLVAVGSTGAVLAKMLEKQDGSVVNGLGLLDMTWKEKTSVFGDDLWFTLADGLQIMGNQIQIADVHLSDNQKPLGKVEYGRGNCGNGDEGAVCGNIIYTGCLGPVMVKNPRFAEKLLKTAAENAGVKVANALDDESVKIEDNAFEMIKEFIEKKMKA